MSTHSGKSRGVVSGNPCRQFALARFPFAFHLTIYCPWHNTHNVHLQHCPICVTPCTTLVVCARSQRAFATFLPSMCANCHARKLAGSMSAEVFFKEYWQKKVVVLPGHDAGVRYDNLVPHGDELAAMIPSTSTHPNRLNKGVRLHARAEHMPTHACGHAAPTKSSGLWLSQSGRFGRAFCRCTPAFIAR